MRFCFLMCLAAGCVAASEPTGVLAARWHDSGFAEADDNYNAVTAASDGKIYYVLSAHKIDQGARMFSFDPASSKITQLADLTEASGEGGLRAIPQGKSHVPFFEHQGKLYFATHLGYYQVAGGKELVGVPPAGYKPYPGGHFLAYDVASGRIEKLASAPAGEGIITMAMDARRGLLYGLSWPTGSFLVYNIATRKLRNFGPVAGKGEQGEGATFRVVCRAIAVEPRGFAYVTTSTGDIFRYEPETERFARIESVSMRRPAFGSLDADKPGHMGYNWRQIVWVAAERSFYGVHGGSGMLFRFDPGAQVVEVIDRIAAEKTRRAGASDAFAYGYLGLTLGPDGRTLYYLTGTPAGEEIRLVTYNIPERRYIDHGAVVLEDGRRPTWAQAIAVGGDGRVYTVSKVDGKTDLVSFPDPLRHTHTEPSYRMIRSWLNPTGMPHPLKEAHSLCFDRDGNVLVIDSVGSRVQRFTPEGKWLGEIGLGPGDGPGAFLNVRDAKVSLTGEIYALDTGHFRVQVFDRAGKFVRTFGEKGSGPGQMLRAHGLDFSPDGSRVYVVDVDNNRVSVFEAASGKFLFSFGRKGGGTGEFRDAHGIGVAANGDVLVSNYYGPVQRFTSEGKFLFEFAPAGFRGMVHFHSSSADAQGNTYLAARYLDGRNATAIYDARGAFVTAIPASAGVGEQGVKAALVDGSGLLYVAVEGRSAHGVQVFQREP